MLSFFISYIGISEYIYSGNATDGYLASHLVCNRRDGVVFGDFLAGSASARKRPQKNTCDHSVFVSWEFYDLWHSVFFAIRRRRGGFNCHGYDGGDATFIEHSGYRNLCQIYRG